MPSFVGYHDFAALAGTTLGIAMATIAAGAWRSLRWLGAAAAAAGVVGVVIAGALATILALLLGAVLTLVFMLARRTFALRRAAAIAGLILAVTLGTLSLRSGDVADYIGFLGKQDEANGNVQSYSQRTVLAYIGLRIFLDHPLTGVGWQASELPVNFEPHLDAARRRFPDVAEQALPSEETTGASRTRTSRWRRISGSSVSSPSSRRSAPRSPGPVAARFADHPRQARSRSGSRSESSCARSSGLRSASFPGSRPRHFCGSSSAEQ